MAEVSVERALQMAAAHYRAGRWSDAEAIYRLIISQIADHAGAMHLLGVLLARQRRSEEAARLLARVVELHPNNADAQSDLGNVLRDLGRWEESAAALRRATALAPASAVPHGNLGNVLRDLGRTDEAIAEYQRAIQINPNFAEAYGNLGNALCDKGKIDEAAPAFRKAIDLKPDFAAGYGNLGVALERLQRSEEAVAAFRRAIELAPDFAEARSNLGQSLESIGQIDEAIATYERAIQIRPDLAGAYCNLGNALLKQKKVFQSLAALRKAIQLDPKMATAYNNLGNALCDDGKPDEAIAAYRDAMRLRPDYAEAMSNLASVLIDEGKLDEPEGLLLKAIEIDPQFPDAHWNLGLFRLLQGDFAGGLPEYEWRWKVKNVMKFGQPFDSPPWDGRELNGRSILLHAEQGFGDAIQFIRYVPQVPARGGRIILQCPVELRRLFRQIPEVGEIVDAGGPPPKFDFHCPLLSLPLAFKTDLNSIPATVPYLRAEAELAESWRKKLEPAKDLCRIGLVWSGAGIHRNDHNRSTVLETFAALGELKDTVFYSLQKGEAGKNPPPAGMDIRDFTPELNDFADTAALIENLDLVIAVDTSVAHLAGAMGKAVWVILPCNPDWRWMYDRSDSPWYPTMRLFRQQRPGDWTATISKVMHQLRQRKGNE